MFTYIFEKVSSVHLSDNIPEYISLRSFMYRTLQQKVQCAIDSFVLLVSMNQLGRQAAKTAGNGVELNWSWKKESFISKSLSKRIFSTLFDDTVGTAVEIVWAEKSNVARLEGKSLRPSSVRHEGKSLVFPQKFKALRQKFSFPTWCSTLTNTSTSCCRSVPHRTNI